MRALLHKIAVALVAYGPWGVFLLSVIDSMGVPLPAAMDALVIGVAATSTDTPQRAYFTALMAVLGSAGGNIALFMAAQHGRKLFSKGDPQPGRSQKFQQWFHRYGLVTVFVPAVTPILPLPLKVFVISAGALRTRLSRFLAVILLARILRYFGLAYLGLQLGADAQGFLQRNGWTLTGIALAMTFVLYFLIRFRRPSVTPTP